MNSGHQKFQQHQSSSSHQQHQQQQRGGPTFGTRSYGHQNGYGPPKANYGPPNGFGGHPNGGPSFGPPGTNGPSEFLFVSFEKLRKCLV